MIKYMATQYKPKENMLIEANIEVDVCLKLHQKR